MSEKEILAKTVYLEALSVWFQPEKIWRAIAFVIMTRIKLNKSYWGGNTVRGVCLKEGQFECWNSNQNQAIDNASLYERIKGVTDRIYDGNDTDDPTGNADHYNNLDKKGYPEWTQNCVKTVKIGAHQFYKSKKWWGYRNCISGEYHWVKH